MADGDKNTKVSHAKRGAIVFFTVVAALVCVLVLLILRLTGCMGGGAAPSPTPSPSPTPAPSATATPAPTAFTPRTATIRAVGDLMMHAEQLEAAHLGGEAYDFSRQYAMIADSLSAAGVYELKAAVATAGYAGEVTRTITVVDTTQPFLFADAEATISQIVPRGYGADKTDNSYVANFNGRDAIMAETNPETSSSNGNTYKWPGIDIHTSLSLANLNDLKEMGYTTMIIPVYITDSDVDSLDIYYGPNGDKIGSVAMDQWVELEIPIDTVISSYNTTLSDYFIYIDNENAGNYITYYIGDITLIAKA